MKFCAVGYDDRGPKLVLVLGALHLLELHLMRAVGQQSAETQLRVFCTLGLISKGSRWKESVLLRGVKLPSASLSQAVEMVLYGSLVEFSLTS